VDTEEDRTLTVGQNLFRAFSSRRRKQSAADLLVLAGLDPHRHELWEMRLYRPTPLRYRTTDVVAIRKDARFVAISEAIRDLAGVADEADL
jgi:hypothetical protein